MGVIDPIYLPFSADHLEKHFAPVESHVGDRSKYTKYYRDSAERSKSYAAQAPRGTTAEIAKAKVWALQMQKDERFWIAATLMKIYHAPNRDALISDLLTRCLGSIPPFDGCATWIEALGTNPVLYFEVSLPSPPAYKSWLADNLKEHSLIPHTLNAALASGKTALEGKTVADAMLVAPDTGFAVVFEAKVLSDASGHVVHDGTRNQVARNIDVLMEKNTKLHHTLNDRDPRRSCFVMVTPELFRKHPESRLYGWLINGYRRDPALLHKHLPHRDAHDLADVSRRLGWLTWEDCNRVLPGTCPWLP
jgi:hypothetical protein